MFYQMRKIEQGKFSLFESSNSHILITQSREKLTMYYKQMCT